MRSTSAQIPLPEPSLRTRHFRGVAGAMVVSAWLLAAVGILVIQSASSELPIDYLPRQATWLLLGFFVMALGAALDYHFLLRHSGILYLSGLASVALILAFGHVAGGARSWIGIASFGGQPSDYAKIVTALFLCRFLAEVRQERLSSRHILWALAIVAVPMALIAAQPDLGGALMFLPMVAVMVVVAGVPMRTVVALGLVAIVLALAVWTFALRPYQRDRVSVFLAPQQDPLGAGYQVRQSKIAVGSGELLGKGHGQGSQSKLRFLPARHTDFVFAVLAEEHGFAGVLGALILYGLFLFNGVRVALSARDREGVLLVVGLLGVLGAYTLYNTAMVIGLLPITGIPLPFLSYGGSFTLFCFFATGLILGVDFRRYVNR